MELCGLLLICGQNNLHAARQFLSGKFPANGSCAKDGGSMLQCWTRGYGKNLGAQSPSEQTSKSGHEKGIAGFLLQIAVLVWQGLGGRLDLKTNVFVDRNRRTLSDTVLNLNSLDFPVCIPIGENTLIC